MMQSLLDILVWVSLWFITFGLLSVLTKKGITYTQRYGWLIIFFLGCTSLAFFYFWKTVSKVMVKFMATPFIILLFVSILAIMVYYFSHKHLRRPTKLIEKYPHQFFIKMDYRYLLSKSFDILFQQVMIVILVLWLAQRGFSLSEITPWFVVLFGGIHLLALPLAGKIFGTFYLIASLFGAILFPMLILTVQYGFVYSYVVHFLFYTVSAVFFWLFAEKRYRKSTPKAHN